MPELAVEERWGGNSRPKRSREPQDQPQHQEPVEGSANPPKRQRLGRRVPQELRTLSKAETAKEMVGTLTSKEREGESGEPPKNLESIESERSKESKETTEDKNMKEGGDEEIRKGKETIEKATEPEMTTQGVGETDRREEGETPGDKTANNAGTQDEQMMKITLKILASASDLLSSRSAPQLKTDFSIKNLKFWIEKISFHP